MLKKGSGLRGCQSGIFQQLEEIEENKVKMQSPALLTLPAPCSHNSFAANRETGRKGPDGAARALIFPLLRGQILHPAMGEMGKKQAVGQG